MTQKKDTKMLTVCIVKSAGGQLSTVMLMQELPKSGTKVMCADHFSFVSFRLN